MPLERRKYSRIATDQVISFSCLDEGEQLAVGKNLSTGGIRFETVGCEIEMGETLRVTFNVEDQTVVAIGTVVWATDLDLVTMDIGLEFMDIDSRAMELLKDAVAASDHVLADHES